MDCGLDYRKVEGLFSKTDSRKGIRLSWPLDLKLAAEIRRGNKEAASGELDGGAMAGIA
jgi:hypothetical protein